MLAYSIILLPFPTFYSVRQSVWGDFWTKFSNFIHFLKIYPPILRFWVHWIEQVIITSLPCISGQPKFFYTKRYDHRKSRILGLFFQKLPSRIGDFGISVENGLWEAPLHKRLRPVFFKKILMTLKKVIFLQFFKSQKYVYSGILQLSWKLPSQTWSFRFNEERVWAKIVCISAFVQFFQLKKVMAFRKVNVLIFCPLC